MIRALILALAVLPATAQARDITVFAAASLTDALTRAAACEWGRDGIRTNAILPLASSPGMAWWMEHNAAEAAQFLDTIPLGRVGDCERDIGDFVVQLCSDACSYINGQSIGVDGGQALIA